MTNFMYFNSIKVRLERPFRLYRKQARSFQIHKGTIRTAESAKLLQLLG